MMTLRSISSYVKELTFEDIFMMLEYLLSLVTAISCIKMRLYSHSQLSSFPRAIQTLKEHLKVYSTHKSVTMRNEIMQIEFYIQNKG